MYSTGDSNSTGSSNFGSNNVGKQQLLGQQRRKQQRGHLNLNLNNLQPQLKKKEQIEELSNKLLLIK